MVPGSVMNSARLLAFTVTVVLLVAVPGPSVLFVVGRALAYGRRAALLTVLGNAGGVYVLALLVAVGLGPLLARSEALLVSVKLAGAAYLVVLGVRALRRRQELEPVGAVVTAVPMGAGRLLREGATVGLLNPKALVFFSAVLPQFVDPASGSVPVQLGVLGAVFVVVALASDSLWGLAAGSARAWFTQRPRWLLATERAGGALMVGLGGALGWEATRA